MTPRFALKKTSNGSETELRASMSVGKLDTSDLVLREGLPSRQHARLTLEGDELFVEDLQSRNGTFVNDQRIAARTRLYGGDKVRFDTEEFAVIGPPRVAPVQDDQATQFRAPTRVAPPPVATATRAPTPAAPAPSPAPAPPPAPAPVATAPIAEAAPPRRPAPEAAKAQDRRPPAWLEAGNSDDKTKFVKRKPAPQADTSTEKLDAANVPGAVQVPTLQIISRTGAGNRFELASDGSPRQEWSVGSDATNRIALSDPEISAVHAVISREGSQWKVVDKFSTNGTFVNDQSTVARILAPGDRLRFGTVEARFLLPAGGVFGSLRGPGAPPSSVVKTLGKSRMLWLAAGGFVLMLIAVAVVIKFLM